MSRGTASKTLGPFHTVCSRTHIHRRLKSLEEVIGKELGAPYTCQHIPEMGQIVLTPEKESTPLGPTTEPTLWDKTVCAVWCFQSLHLSRTETQYLTPQLATGVTWPNVYDTLRQLAQPAVLALEAVDGNGTIIYGAACPLPARARQWYKCRAIPFVDV